MNTSFSRSDASDCEHGVQYETECSAPSLCCNTNFKTLPDKIIKQIEKFETPFFLFDLDKIGVKIRYLYESLNVDQIFFALKSNSLPQILEAIASYGCGFEVNNFNELKKVSETGVHSFKIINSSPIVPAADVQKMYENGVNYFTFDSKEQVQNIKINAPNAKTIMRFFSTNEGSRFKLNKNLGVDPTLSFELLNYAKANGLRIYGLTFHVGSQCYSPSNWHAGIAQCAVLFKQFPELEMINIGGGFPVQYTTSTSEIAQIIRVINKSVNTCFKRRPLLFVEPGRFIVGDSALACTSVINVNHQNSISRAAVDLSVFGGLMEIIESSDGFHYPVEASGNGDLRPYRIIGSTCAGTDVIAEEVMLPQLAVDLRIPKQSSRIYLSNTGAYTLDYVMNADMHGFNGLNIPQVYYIKNGKILEGK